MQAKYYANVLDSDLKIDLLVQIVPGTFKKCAQEFHQTPELQTWILLESRIPCLSEPKFQWTPAALGVVLIGNSMSLELLFLQ